MSVFEYILGNSILVQIQKIKLLKINKRYETQKLVKMSMNNNDDYHVILSDC